jgi:hypothetical protein
MATSISFGLGFATMLVLFVVPVLISYIEQFSGYLKAGKAQYKDILTEKLSNKLR